MGEQRFADYEHESRLQNSSIKDIAQRYNLPKETAYQALDVTWTAQERAMRLRTNPALSEEQRHEMLLGLRGQMESSLQQLLTPEGYSTYMKRRHGWMNVFPTPAK